MPVKTTSADPLKAPGVPVQTAPRPEHRYDIDLLRVIACCGVILCHIGAEYLIAVGGRAAGGSAVYWVGLGADSLSRFAVPVFFAIAGWVVLVGAPPRDERALRRRLVKILAPLGVWTAVYLAWDRLRGWNTRPSSELALESVLGSVRPAFHLWYLYSYVPVVMLLALVVMVRAGRRPWVLGGTLSALVLARPLLGDVADLTGWDLPRFGWGFAPYQVAYAVAGALLLSLPASACRGLRRALWAAAAGAAVAAVLWYQHTVHHPSPYASVFVAASASAVMLALHRVRVPERARPLLARLGAAAFGAYLVHVLVIRSLVRPFVSPDAGWGAAAALAAALTLGTVALSFGASLLWGRLGLRRFLG